MEIYYSRNFMIINTEGSFILMYLFLHDHWYKLSIAPDDPFFNAIRFRFGPFFANFNTAYNVFTNAEKISKAATTTVNNSFKLLGKDYINRWDVSFQIPYPKNTSTYREVFADGHKPFYTGTLEMRLQALDAFVILLIPIPDIDPIKAEVADFQTLIHAQWEDHKKKLEKLKLTSEALETERINIGTQMYGTVGELMFKYMDTPEKIEDFFDFNIIRPVRTKKANVFVSFIAGGETKNLVERTFTNSSKVLIENLGETDLCFALVPTATTPCIDTGIIIEPKSKKSVWVSSMGELDYTFLNVSNLHSFTQGHYSVSDYG